MPDSSNNTDIRGHYGKHYKGNIFLSTENLSLPALSTHFWFPWQYSIGQGKRTSKLAIQRHCGWLLHIISVPNSSIFCQVGSDFRLVPNETDGALQAVLQAYILFD